MNWIIKIMLALTFLIIAFSCQNDNTQNRTLTAKRKLAQEILENQPIEVLEGILENEEDLFNFSENFTFLDSIDNPITDPVSKVIKERMTDNYKKRRRFWNGKTGFTWSVYNEFEPFEKCVDDLIVAMNNSVPKIDAKREDFGFQSNFGMIDKEVAGIMLDSLKSQNRIEYDSLIRAFNTRGRLIDDLNNRYTVVNHVTFKEIEILEEFKDENDKVIPTIFDLGKLCPPLCKP